MIKTYAAQLVGRGQVAASRPALTRWAQQLPRPWVGALEATMLTGWVYDCLRPLAQRLEVAHPAMLQAIACAKKKKNDSLDAEKIGDLLRCDLLPTCYLAPSEIRELRRILRYRNLLLREAVRRNNKVAGLLMEVGALYHKQRLHAKGYFYPLLAGLEETPPSVRQLLTISRSQRELFPGLERSLLAGLRRHPRLRERVARRETMAGRRRRWRGVGDDGPVGVV